MSTLRLAVGRRYDRIQPLADRPHTVGGHELHTEILSSVQESFQRVTHSDDFDLGEMSLAFFVSLMSQVGDDCPIIGLPIFVSRAFRYGNIYVREGETGDPKQLDGARIGVFEYAMTMATWLRGMIRDDTGVDLGQSATWVTTRRPIVLDEDFANRDRKIEYAGADRSLPELLRAGEIDAFFGTTPRAASGELEPGIVRLCPDYHERDVAYFQRTGCFPIMHIIAMRRATYEAIGGDAVREICQLFADVKAEVISEHLWDGALDVTMPFILPSWERQAALLGDDPWPYGFEANRHVFEKFLDYLQHEELLPRRLPVEELFVPETLDLDLSTSHPFG